MVYLLTSYRKRHGWTWTPRRELSLF